MYVAKYVLFAVLLVALVTLIVLSLRAAAAGKQAWANFARQRGYTYTDLRIAGTFDSVAFVVDTVPGSKSSRYMRVSGRALNPLPATIDVRQRGKAPPPPASLKIVEVGDPDFDATFVVAADDPGLPRSVLDAEARRLLLEFATGPLSTRAGAAGLTYRAGDVEATMGLEARAEALDAAIKLVAAACRAR
jgi:hypothetical protein